MMALKWVLEKFEEHQTEMKLRCDNLHVVNKSNQGRMFGIKSLRHVRTRFGYLYERILLKDVLLEHIKTDKNPADMFTKSLGSEKIQRHCQTINLL